jgi:hypothetical protein
MKAKRVQSFGVLLTLALVSPAHSASPWRYWNKGDGLMESWVFGLTSNSEGQVVVKHGEVPSESLLDGYRINTIPSKHGYGRLLSPPGTGADKNELWTFDTEGILIHDASGWRQYPDSEIAEFAKSSRMSLIPWYLYSISSYRGAGQQRPHGCGADRQQLGGHHVSGSSRRVESHDRRETAGPDCDTDGAGALSRCARFR